MGDRLKGLLNNLNTSKNGGDNKPTGDKSKTHPHTKRKQLLRVLAFS